uniref:Uncharacterized protein n=1 Tax=Sipha flava TaxID=143950 RepID=A0A2S2QMI7_9HEMI
MRSNKSTHSGFAPLVFHYYQLVADAATHVLLLFPRYMIQLSNATNTLRMDIRTARLGAKGPARHIFSRPRTNGHDDDDDDDQDEGTCERACNMFGAGHTGRVRRYLRKSAVGRMPVRVMRAMCAYVRAVGTAGSPQPSHTSVGLLIASRSFRPRNILSPRRR